MATREELLRNKDETLSLSARRRYANNASNSLSYAENDDDLYDLGLTTGNSKGVKGDKDWAGSDSNEWNATANTYGTLKEAKGQFDKTVSSKDTTVKRSFDNADTFQRDRINKMIEQQEDGEYDEYGDYEDDYGEDEINVMDDAGDVYRNNNTTTYDDNETRPYQNPLLKPIIKVGGLEIGLSKAKLYGLVDGDGNVALPGEKRDVLKTKNDARRYFKKMAAPREINADEILEKFDEEKPTFKPTRNRDAEAAMRNPRCGYDFVDRLKAKGDFLDRAFGGSTNAKAEKKKTDVAEEAYKDRIDKLRCPLCKREQSFQQFFTKQRDCNQCGVRFVPSKVHSSVDFEARMADAERRRAEKLKKLDDEVYASAPPPQAKPAPKTDPGLPKARTATVANSVAADSKTARLGLGAGADAKHSASGNVSGAGAGSEAEAKAGAAEHRGAKRSAASARTNSPQAAEATLKRSRQEQQDLLKQLQRSVDGGAAPPSIEVLELMAKLQQERTALITQTINEAERRYGGGASRGGAMNSSNKRGVKVSQEARIHAPKTAPADVLQQLATAQHTEAALIDETLEEARRRGCSKGDSSNKPKPSKFLDEEGDDDESDRYSDAFSSLLLE